MKRNRSVKRLKSKRGSVARSWRTMNITSCCPSFLLQGQPRSENMPHGHMVIPGTLPKAALNTPGDGCTPCNPAFLTNPKIRRRQETPSWGPPKPKKQMRSATLRVIADNKAVQAKAKQPLGQSGFTVPIPKMATAPVRPQQVILVEDSDAEEELWITRSLKLPAERRNGWVVAWIIETHHREAFVLSATGKTSYDDRLRKAGLGDLLDVPGKPRQKCSLLAKATTQKEELLDEQGQRRKLDSISKSWPAYCSGIKCYAAFCDAMGYCPHFPASVRVIIRFSAMFCNADSLQQYIKHVRWAHRFLGIDDSVCSSPEIQQVINGLKKSMAAPLPKPALTSKQVLKMVKESMREGDIEMAGILAIARHFMLRMPSEAVPLEWDGGHSKITVEDTRCSITLTTRKNRRAPSTMTRHCSCEETGRLLCSVHWLKVLRDRPGTGGRVFKLNKDHLARRVKQLVAKIGVEDAERYGTHAVRRGMAQDILDMGGQLPALLKAGDWRSSAYLRYLRVSQTDDVAVAQAAMFLSDSDEE